MSASPLFYRQGPLNALVGALTASFNSNLAAFASAYGDQTPFEIGFDGTLGNFAIMDIDDFEISPVKVFPALCVFSADAEDRGDPRGFRWVGPVLLAARLCVRYREGVELPLTLENTVNWIDDAFFAAINDPSIQWPGGVIYDRTTKAPRAYRTKPLGDGWELIIEFAIPFTVAVTN